MQCAGIKLLLISSQIKISGAASGQERGGEVNHLIFQARTSYLPSEIVWGQRLCYTVTTLADKNYSSPHLSRFEHKTVVYDQKEAKYAVSYTTLNTFVPDNTPRCFVICETCHPVKISVNHLPVFATHRNHH